ncbi:MAG: YgaP family membrane protein [Nitrospiraceae bacterium]
MECNVGGIERGIRILVGVLLLSLGLFGGLTGWQAGLADGVGAIALLSGAFGFCPAWKLLGINTCGINQTNKA